MLSGFMSQEGESVDPIGNRILEMVDRIMESDEARTEFLDSPNSWLISRGFTDIATHEASGMIPALIAAVEGADQGDFDDALRLWVASLDLKNLMSEDRVEAVCQDARERYRKENSSSRRSIVKCLCSTLVFLQLWMFASPGLASISPPDNSSGRFGAPLYKHSPIEAKGGFSLELDFQSEEHWSTLATIAGAIVENPDEGSKFREDPAGYLRDTGLPDTTIDLNAYEMRIILALAKPSVRKAIASRDAARLISQLEEESGVMVATQRPCIGVLAVVAYVVVAVYSAVTVAVQVAAAAAYAVAVATEMYTYGPNYQDNDTRELTALLYEHLTDGERLAIDLSRISGDRELGRDIEVQVAQNVMNRAQLTEVEQEADLA